MTARGRHHLRGAGGIKGELRVWPTLFRYLTVLADGLSGGHSAVLRSCPIAGIGTNPLRGFLGEFPRFAVPIASLFLGIPPIVCLSTAA